MNRALGTQRCLSVDKYAVLISIGFFSLAPSAYGQLKSSSCAEYRGTLDEKIQIGMNLYVENQELTGSYFYKRQMKDIPLSGRYPTGRDIELMTVGPASIIGEKFHLRFADRDSHYQTTEPLQAEVLEGKWISADGKTTYSVYVRLDHDCVDPAQGRYAPAGAKDDAVVEKNTLAFYEAILAGKRADAAKLVAYPATFFQNKKQLSIANATEFLNYYDHIFTTTFVARIRNGTPHHMFVNAQGIMLADGAVWFDAEGKAKHFNNELPGK